MHFDAVTSMLAQQSGVFYLNSHVLRVLQGESHSLVWFKLITFGLDVWLFRLLKMGRNLYSGVFVCFRAKSGITNNHRTGLSDISY